jgi:uncharacterized membrane protein YbhN (UPF0104 family)
MTWAKENARTLLKLGVTLAAVAYVVFAFDVERIVTVLGENDPVLVAVAVGVTVVGVFVSAAKWLLLLRSKGESPPYRELVRSYYIGVFFNAVLPSTVGGDTVRAYRTTGDVEDSVEAYSSVYVERYTGLVALCLLAVAASVLRPGPVSFEVSLGLAAVVVGAAVLSLAFAVPWAPYVAAPVGLLPAWAVERIERFHESVRSYQHEGAVLGAVLAVSLFFHLLPVLNHWLLSVGLGIDVSPLFLLIVIPLAQVILFVPISIRGYGVREVLYIALLSPVGVSPAEAVALSVTVQVVGLVQSGIGGMVYYLSPE